MFKKILKVISLLSSIILLGGCFYITKREQIAALKEIGASQRQGREYIKRQSGLFDKLLDDVKNNRLRKGMSKERVLAEYGEPVFCQEAAEGSGFKETCLYRHPTVYFDTDKVYLDFDSENNLCDWEFQPAA